MHSKGILYRNKQIHEQGFFNKNKLDAVGSMYEVVDLKINENNKAREEKLK